MVRRLIEDQQVDGLQQQLDHCQSGTFATGEHLYFFRRILASEHESTQQILDLVADISFCNIVYRLEHRQVFI